MREIAPVLCVLFTSSYVENEPVELDSQGPGVAYKQKPVGHAEFAPQGAGSVGRPRRRVGSSRHDV